MRRGDHSASQGFLAAQEAERRRQNRRLTSAVGTLLFLLTAALAAAGWWGGMLGAYAATTFVILFCAIPIGLVCIVAGAVLMVRDSPGEGVVHILGGFVAVPLLALLVPGTAATLRHDDGEEPNVLAEREVALVDSQGREIRAHVLAFGEGSIRIVTAGKRSEHVVPHERLSLESLEQVMALKGASRAAWVRDQGP